MNLLRLGVIIVFELMSRERSYQAVVVTATPSLHSLAWWVGYKSECQVLHAYHNGLGIFLDSDWLGD